MGHGREIVIATCRAEQSRRLDALSLEVLLLRRDGTGG